MAKEAGKSYIQRKKKWGYIFLIPWFANFLIFYAYPLLYGIYVSFTDYNMKGMNWVWLDNFIKIFSDYSFWRSLWAMVKYSMIIIPLRTFVPLWLANALRHHGKGFTNLVKVLIYLPGVVCTTALVISWKIILAPGTGFISEFIQTMGLGEISLLDNANLSIPIMSLLIVFSNIGANLIVFCAALNAVPDSYYEAAELDGANRSKQFWHISIPMVQPTIVYVLITSTIATLQVFVIPQLLTGGGPNFTSSTLLMLIYDSAFIKYKFGYASAIGVILFLITAIVAFIQFKVTNREKIEY